MSISERIAVAKPVKECKVCIIIASLPEHDRELVVSQFDKNSVGRIGLQKLSEILTAEGYPVHRHTLAAHSRVCL